jgi:hemerythrin-like metal-binding protein/PAS domain S-box-containing protein
MKTTHTRPILGIPEMDTQHDHLYSLFDRIETETSESGMADLLQEIEGYLDFHFTSEEHLIRHYKVPDFAAHQADHEQAAEAFFKHLAAFEHGTMNPARFHNAMTGWFSEHAEATDMQYAKFIRERRQNEHQTSTDLRESEIQHLKLFETLRVGVVVHAPDTSIMLNNPEATRLLGLTTDQLRGKTAIDPAWQFVRDDGTPMPLDAYPVNQVLASMQPLPDFVMGVDRPATADRVWVLVNAYPEFGPQEELQSIVVTFVDITARKRAEEAVRASEAIFEYFMEYSPMHVFFKDENRRALRLSKNYETMLGKPRSELLGKSMDELFPSDMAEQMMADDVRIMEEGKEITVEETLDGRSYSTTKFPIWVDGVPRYLAGYTMDITDRKQAEEEKTELQKQLLQSQKMESVGRLAGGVAHDFNNMLMGIMGYAELCRDELPPDHVIHPYLNELTRAAQRSADLTRQLLAFASKQAIAPEVLDLNDVITGMLKLLRHLIGENINLAWRPAEALMTVSIDPSQIDQILVNLCVNARDAINGTGNVTVSSKNVTLDDAYCTEHPNATPGRYVLITVVDDGCGMDKDTLAHVFEPFFTTKGSGKGTGLGLATVYGIVRQNNGYIDVHTEVNEGTTFRVYLPQFAGEDAKTSEPKEERAPTGGNETILLVEDEKALRVTCRHFLRTLGYTFLVAATPAEALNLAAQHSGDIHLLLTDVVMPEMDGQQLATQLKSSDPGLNVLYMSGYTADAVTDLGVDEDGVSFIGKPFSRDDLARKLREILDEPAGL